MFIASLSLLVTGYPLRVIIKKKQTLKVFIIEISNLNEKLCV